MVPPLKKLSGKIALGTKWFSQLVDRVEETKPIAGNRIIVTPTQDGCKISMDAKVYPINVCVNGYPQTILLYGVLNPQTDAQGDFNPANYAPIA